MQSAKEKKQEYLRDEILEPGYDPEEFLGFLVNQGFSNDIDELSFQQLESIVLRFKKTQETGSPEKRQSHKHLDFDDVATKEQTHQEKKDKVKQILYPKYGVSQPQFQKTFKCLKVKESNNEVPKIQVSEKSTGGLFGIGATSFLLFKIDTIDKGWSVRRRYSDFQWLRAVVSKFFPTHIIPPIPSKKASKKTTRDLVRRMHILTFFLNDLASCPEMFSSKYIQGFMSMTNDSEFQKLKKEGNNTQAFETIASLQTTTGDVTVGLSQQQNTFCSQLQTLFNGIEGLYKQTNAKAKLLQNCYVEETNILYQMGNQFADIHTLLQSFNKKVPKNSQDGLGTVFVNLNNMVIEWGNIVKSQFDFIERSFLPFFRYSRNQIYSFRQQYAKVTQLEQDYFKTRAVLDNKKNKLFSLNDINKWEIPQAKLSIVPPTAVKNKQQAFKYMLPKQSQQLDKNRLNYAFYISQYKSNALRLLDHNTQRFNNNFKQFTINIKVNAQQLAGLWTQVATSFANPQKNKNIINKKAVIDNNSQYLDD